MASPLDFVIGQSVPESFYNMPMGSTTPPGVKVDPTKYRSTTTAPKNPLSNFANLFQYNAPAPASQSIQGATQAANLATAPQLTDILNLINSISLNAQQAANAARIPGATGLEAQSSANIGAALGGQLPADVQRNIAEAAAERGVATGTPGSPNSNAAYLRALGLTSLGLQGQGQQWLTGALGRNPAAPIADPMQQLLTPAQQGQLGIETGYLNQQQLGRFQPGIFNVGNVSPKGPVLTSTGTQAPDTSWFDQLFSNVGTPSPAFPYKANPYATATSYNTGQGYADEAFPFLDEPGSFNNYPSNDPFLGEDYGPVDDLSYYGDY